VSTNGKSRIELERQATLVRSRLIRAVEELERRGHDALDLRLQLRNHLRRVLLAAAGLMLVTAGSIVLVVQRMTAAAERRRLARGGIFRGGWRVARAPVLPPRRNFFAEIGRSFAIAAISTCAMIPVRRFATQLAAQPAPRDGAPSRRSVR
jgi:hypothetical protein